MLYETHGRVYPRVCGGACRRLTGLSWTAGLSPRVRGSPPKPPGDPRPSWSIPACAGEPSSSRRCGSVCPVYPRVCGGAFSHVCVHVGRGGLSPRVRGSRAYRHSAYPLSRSIPACAGEPSAARRYALPFRVYPRVCGGACPAEALYQRYLGLSPRVRGSPSATEKSLGEARSIPACAGEPLESQGWTAVSEVYPRVCGGAGDGQYLKDGGIGLSPRVRGSPDNVPVRNRHQRSIPACAGEPLSVNSRPATG